MENMTDELELWAQRWAHWSADLREPALALLIGLAEWERWQREKVAVAIEFCVRAHQGQLRKSGLPYATHPIAVAQLCWGLGLDCDALCAALLHDVVEDTPATLPEIDQAFGSAVAQMVDALTKIDALRLSGPDGAHLTVGAQQASTLRKMMLAMSRDMRVIVIKLCDRKHNMSTLGSLPRHRQLAIAEETQAIYAPIASRLGMNGMWQDLSESCFLARHPWRNQVLGKALRLARSHQRSFIEASVQRIGQELEREGIDAVVSGRSKSVSSVHEKMVEKRLKLAQVLDREGARIIVSNRAQCYATLGILHALWKPIPGMFKDYIAIPKINGYQSLHTALLNENGSPMEVQIRTLEMHQRAEEGIAAHWSYKAKDQGGAHAQPWLWLQSLLDIQASTPHSDDFLEHVRTDLFSDEVYVFSPAGEVISLPRGASALDFAFAIHSDVGLKALGAQINGESAALSARLRSGDRVKIETSPIPVAKPGWLMTAKTGKARAHIRAYLRGLEQGAAQEFGEGLLHQALADLGVDEGRVDEISWSKALRSLAIGGKEEALLRLAQGQMSPLALAQKLAIKSTRKGEPYQRRALLVSGEEGEYVRMSPCCAPLPPVPIKGLVTPNEGIWVHRSDCVQLRAAKVSQERVDLDWEPEALTRSFSALLKIKARNERGALATIAACIAAQGADVNNVRVSGNNSGEGRAVIDFDVQVRSKFHLDRVIEALSKESAVVHIL